LTRLALSYFRSHKTADLALDGRPVALWGRNGAGKTNILEAVSLLSPGRGIRRAGPDEISRRPENLGWKVTAEIDSLAQCHEVETRAEQGFARQVRIDGKAASQTALGKLARMVWLVPAMDRLWLEGPEGRRRFLDRMALSFYPTHGEATLAYEKAMRERNRLLRDQVANDSWYRALERQMATSGAQITLNRASTLDRLASAQTDAETSFPTAELTLIGPQDGEAVDNRDDLAEALAKGRSRDMAAGRCLAGPHRADLGAVYQAKNTEARLCSTGEQKALLISLVLANARALAEDFAAPPIILLDEVAAHLDAGRRTALYDEICDLGAQAWMTGTDASLFQALGERAAWYEVTEADGLSRVTERPPQ